MTRRFFCLICLLALLPVGAGAAPQRIVSLTPANTEMLFALGLGGKVVGDTTYCDYPPAAKKITKIGDTRVNYERVAALRPDLIVGDSSATPEADARLAQLHLPVLALQTNSLDQIEASLRLLGRRAGASAQANGVVARMQGQRRMAQTIAASDPRRLRVLFIVGLNPLYVAGRGTFLDSLITEAGGVNDAGISGYGSLSKELVLAHPPDVIAAAPADQAALRADPALRTLAAVRTGRFVWVSDPDLLERPGPRVTLGLLQLARALHGKSG